MYNKINVQTILLTVTDSHSLSIIITNTVVNIKGPTENEWLKTQIYNIITKQCFEVYYGNYSRIYKFNEKFTNQIEKRNK